MVTAFSFQTTNRCGYIEIAVVGELDIDSADLLAQAGVRHLRDPSTEVLTLDLSAVTFIDSSGISALIQMRVCAARADTKLRLARMPGVVRHALGWSALEGAFIEALPAPANTGRGHV